MAQHLCRLCDDYNCSVLVSHSMTESNQGAFAVREVDRIRPWVTSALNTTSNTSTTIYEIVSDTNSNSDHERMSSLICYELGLADYRMRNWNSAVLHFKKAFVPASYGQVAKSMLSRCERLSREESSQPIGQTWDGAWPII